MAESAIEFLRERLNQLGKGLIDCPFYLAAMNQRDCIYEELQSVTTILKDSKKEIRRGIKERIRDVAYEAADSIDLSLINYLKKDPVEEALDVLYPRTVLSDVLKQIRAVNEQVLLEVKPPPKRGKIKKRIFEQLTKMVISVAANVEEERTKMVANVEEEIVVGFDHEAEMLLERLTGRQKQLEIVSIVGMAGLGKTTLARKLYQDPFTVHHFYVRAWASVSQVYRKRDLLLAILSCVVHHKKIDSSTVSHAKLGEELYKSLKGKRYLVVMDDIWQVEVWNDLKIYFPDDKNGSRILFTSRQTEVALQAKLHLHFLNESDSWDLLQKKIFGLKQSCPPDLTDIGMQIARKCNGLPLAIVVVAGLLAKTDKSQDLWKQVFESFSSHIVGDTNQILALSYDRLPCYLRLCFLYFGAFPEDYEIPVGKLIWLWIAEGFIHPIGDKILEDVAEDYLMNLIDRNLVLVAKRRSTGGIKACRVHDLLHDFCLRKALQEKFLQQIYKARLGYDQHPSSSSLVTIRNKYRRLCVNSHIINDIPSNNFASHIRSFLCFVSEQSSSPLGSMSFNYLSFILLTVLDLSSISILSFPSEIVQLLLLRYLALRGKHLTIPSSIGNLQNLEILSISDGEISVIPIELWNICTLRHLRIAGKNDVIPRAQWRFFTLELLRSGVINNDTYPFSCYYNLQTISHITPTRPCQDLLVWTPNLRKLAFCGSFNSLDCVNFWFPDLDFLNCLEALKLLNVFVPRHHTYNLQGVKFPPNLKRLTLSKTALGWKEMSVIGMLPHLEVLKLEFQACIGSLWETNDGGFRRLKYLRLYYMDLEQWNASSIHFPILQHLVLHNCHKLKEIPSALGDIYTLQKIEVISCCDSAVNSAREIQKEQEDIGNDSLKIIIINPLDWELETYSQVCVELQ